MHEDVRRQRGDHTGERQVGVVQDFRIGGEVPRNRLDGQCRHYETWSGVCSNPGTSRGTLLHSCVLALLTCVPIMVECTDWWILETHTLTVNFPASYDKMKMECPVHSNC